MSGAIVCYYSYGPFGKLLDDISGEDNPFRFVGQLGVMAETDDLYYMRARYYDSNNGRFLSEDPLWMPNLYTYANNNPITSSDPEGTKSNISLSGLINATKFIATKVLDYIVPKTASIVNAVDVGFAFWELEEIEKPYNIGQMDAISKMSNENLDVVDEVQLIQKQYEIRSNRNWSEYLRPAKRIY